MSVIPLVQPVALSLTSPSVVFVHGLGSFPDTTWRKAGPNGSHHGGVSWIRDFLPEDLPAARLLFFNYDSTTYNDAPVKDLADIAEELLLAFQSSGVRTTNRVCIRHPRSTHQSYEALMRDDRF